MSQKKYDRVNYHSNTEIARATERRIKLIKKNLNFEDKVVFDLGCSGGFVAESLAEAHKVVAIDADQDVILANIGRGSKHNYSNIEYRLGNLLKLDLNLEGRIDVVLMLSVVHHLFKGSDAYSWNDSNEIDKVIRKIKHLTSFSNTFVLEVGMPYEGYDWCSNLPYNNQNVCEWLHSNLFGKDWSYRRLGDESVIETFIKKPLVRQFPHGTRGASFIKKILQIDIRDLRPIIIFEKKNK